MAPSDVVTAFVRAIETGDMSRAVPFLAEDAVFDNVPLPEPIRYTRGSAAIAERLQPMLSACTKIEWEVLKQISDGRTVFCERVDRFWFKPGMFPKRDFLEWPTCSRWEVENGKISLWRDYFEPNLNEPQLGVSFEEFGSILGHDNYASTH